MDFPEGARSPAWGGSLVLRQKQGSTWLGTSWIMLADIVGTSVLTYAGVARQLGWVLTVAFIVLLAPVAIYTALLMSRTQGMVKQCTGVQPATMGEAARSTLGGGTAAKAVYGIVYGFGFLGQSSYLLAMGQAFQGMLYDVELCLPTAVLASCVVCLPFVVSVRRLSDSVWLCFVNLLLILAVLGIVMAKLWRDGRQEGSRTFLFAEDLSLLTVFGAATNIVFSYTGHWLYFEVMADMCEPEHFPRVFTITTPLQVALYLLVACWGYYFAGDGASGFFLDNLPNGAPYRAASALLFAHVIVAFLVKNVVLTRFLHGLIAPSRVSTRLSEPGGGRAHCEYVCCTLLLLLACFLSANAIPFFMEFMGLVGGLFSGPISFLLPILFYVGASKQLRAATQTSSSVQFGGAVPLDDGLGQAAGAADNHKVSFCMGSECRDAGSNTTSIENLGAPLHAAAAAGCSSSSSLRTLAPRQISGRDWVFFAAVGLITVLTMVVGTTEVIRQIVSQMGSEGPPFSCKLLPSDRQR